jgi:succinate dehydrogenase / fumarate reductase flavoprotein subunit
MASSPAPSLLFHSHDVLIIGAGGAGLRAAIAAAEAGASVAVVTKVPPTRSHTVAAQGGINAALGNVTPDDWRWHMYDTIRGSDWLGDQDSIAHMCKHAPEAIADLDQMGVAFSRDEEGNIYQRAYGGMSTEFGKGGMAFRACAAADHTGDAMMRGLYSYIQRYPVRFFVEFFALDLVMDESGRCIGVLAWELATGVMHVFLAAQVILATGGYGQVYAASTSSSTCTGDGNAMVLRAGLPLQDMEYVQFHPTGLYGVGILISEAARSEGGVLRNCEGERFMERYAPQYADLASRDVVTRAVISEIAAGRGCGKKSDHLLLDLTALDPLLIDAQLPTTKALARQFAGVDVTREMIPVYPTAHYTMGGIPTDRECRVLNAEGRVAEGLYAIGEAACNSVHGANRLGCNSLLDLIVFGKHAGEEAARAARGTLRPSRHDAPVRLLRPALARFNALRRSGGTRGGLELRGEIGRIMQECAGIIRRGSGLKAGLRQMLELARHFRSDVCVRDKSLVWNNDLIAALETENLLTQGIATLASAEYRTESRGAHFRSDFPHRDDTRWLKHTWVAVAGDGAVQLGTRAVRMDPSIEGTEPVLPEERVY